MKKVRITIEKQYGKKLEAWLNENFPDLGQKFKDYADNVIAAGLQKVLERTNLFEDIKEDICIDENTLPKIFIDEKSNEYLFDEIKKIDKNNKNIFSHVVQKPNILRFLDFVIEKQRTFSKKRIKELEKTSGDVAFISITKEKKDEETPKDKNDKEYPHNRIIFGAPGTGKSNKLKTETEGMDKKYVTRVTFHPDYSYAHFVGTYKPVMIETGDKYTNGESQKSIEYNFVPGPFLEVYKKAKKDKDNDYVLIIEEINRANVAAVFGDVFQLLDRKSDGESEYPINTSQDVKKWLTDNDNGVGEVDTLSIPKNMYIWATMNSADQGVYPMDTAFKRRWTFEYLGINDGASKVENWEVTIGGKNYNWDKLRRAINTTLLNANVNEDKCLGPFFIKDGASAEEFASKVLMYLFEDVVKQKPSKIFNAELKGFSSIYNKAIDKCDLKDIFVKDIYEGLVKNAD